MATEITINEKFTKLSKTELLYQDFREDVLDRFYCVCSLIKKKKSSNIDYTSLFNNISKECTFESIMKFISILKNDTHLYKDTETSKIVNQYCDEIMNNKVIQDTIAFMPYKIEKIKKD
jgi:hypothetical protein